MRCALISGFAFLILIADSDHGFNIIAGKLFAQVFHMGVNDPVVSHIILVEDPQDKLFPGKGPARLLF